MDKNWLIRTSQNQILGPVAKSKLLEFVHKGALGMTDEVSSGNGYWFSLKEKELVDKYLFGDIPQSYNPISEAKTVLAHRENPEKTTSINTAPVNKTQVLKSINTKEGVIPVADDLEFPDITLIRAMPNLREAKVVEANISNDTKLPDDNDLEFPVLDSSPDSDLTMISSIKTQTTYAKPTELKKTVENIEKKPVAIPVPVEVVVFPKDDDLEFPNLDDFSIDRNQGRTQTVAISHEQVTKEVVGAAVKQKIIKDVNEVKGARPHRNIDGDFDSSESLSFTRLAKNKERDLEIKEKQEAAQRREKHLDDRKLLHDRKGKVSELQSLQLNEKPKERVAEKPIQRASHQLAEPLKKRNDNYIFFILIILVLIILAVFFYFREILNKPLPV